MNVIIGPVGKIILEAIQFFLEFLKKTPTDLILMILSKNCFFVGTYLPGAAGAPARPDTSGDIFAPINLDFDRLVSHFCEKINREETF